MLRGSHGVLAMALATGVLGGGWPTPALGSRRAPVPVPDAEGQPYLGHDPPFVGVSLVVPTQALRAFGEPSLCPSPAHDSLRLVRIWSEAAVRVVHVEGRHGDATVRAHELELKKVRRAMARADADGITDSRETTLPAETWSRLIELAQRHEGWVSVDLHSRQPGPKAPTAFAGRVLIEWRTAAAHRVTTAGILKRHEPLAELYEGLMAAGRFASGRRPSWVPAPTRHQRLQGLYEWAPPRGLPR